MNTICQLCEEYTRLNHAEWKLRQQATRIQAELDAALSIETRRWSALVRARLKRFGTRVHCSHAPRCWHLCAHGTNPITVTAHAHVKVWVNYDEIEIRFALPADPVECES